MGKAVGCLFALLVIGLAGMASGSPFNEEMTFKQPDGTVISFHGEGNEFYATFTYNGYSIIYDRESRAYYYAKCNNAATALEKTDAVVGVDAVPEGVGLNEEGKILAEARRAQTQARYEKWDAETHTSENWNLLKEKHRAELTKKSGGFQFMAVSPIEGEKVGLTILVDFPDSVANSNIGTNEMEHFLNGENYTNYGNFCSVRSYYLDNSNTNLDYRNVLVPYLRVAHPKTYYNAKTQNDAIQAIVTDTLAELKAQMDTNATFAAEMEDKFSQLTLISGTTVRAFNILYAGEPDVGWGEGLWPCSGSLGFSASLPGQGGYNLNRFQMSNIGSVPKVYTFCHENGHMVCNFPDIYDYDYDAKGGPAFSA